MSLSGFTRTSKRCVSTRSIHQ
uniref:Uncharacterized protein n=1 Tax=Anguilla anguilla TaxID=7936 RepID=A0A0E9XVS3_ANGAN